MIIVYPYFCNIGTFNKYASKYPTIYDIKPNKNIILLV